jgi:hypothetical protein
VAIRRPKLNEDSFLAHLFSPKKAPLPTGLRKVSLSSRAGRKAARLAAFNRMNPFSQELLKRSGTRESYLKGESSLADAKALLRLPAVGKGYARAVTLGPKLPPGFNRNVSRETRYPLRTRQNIAVRHMIGELEAGGYEVARDKMFNRSEFIPENKVDDAAGWSVGRIRYEAGLNANTIDVELQFGMVAHVNPFWYK